MAAVAVAKLLLCCDIICKCSIREVSLNWLLFDKEELTETDVEMGVLRGTVGAVLLLLTQQLLWSLFGSHICDPSVIRPDWGNPCKR